MIKWDNMQDAAHKSMRRDGFRIEANIRRLGFSLSAVAVVEPLEDVWKWHVNLFASPNLSHDEDGDEGGGQVFGRVGLSPSEDAAKQMAAAVVVDVARRIESAASMLAEAFGEGEADDVEDPPPVDPPEPPAVP